MGGEGEKEKKTKEKFGVLLLRRVDGNEWSLLLHSARPPALPLGVVIITCYYLGR